MAVGRTRTGRIKKGYRLTRSGRVVKVTRRRGRRRGRRRR